MGEIIWKVSVPSHLVSALLLSHPGINREDSDDGMKQGYILLTIDLIQPVAQVRIREGPAVVWNGAGSRSLRGLILYDNEQV